MAQHKEQRIGVFVDVQNMYYSAKQLYSSKVDFTQILKTGVAGRKLIRAIAYVIKADIKEEHNFFEALEKIGYEVRSKDLQVFFGGAKKGDWDVGIAMDIMRMASKLDVIVLVSGDGDFKDLIEHVKSLGCRAEVIAFGKTSSSRLKDVVDRFTDLDINKSKYLIPDRRKTSSPRSTTSRSTMPSRPSPRSTTSRSTMPSRPSPRSTTSRSTMPSRPSPRSTTPRSTTPRMSSSRPPYRKSASSSQETRMTPQQSMLARLNMEQPQEPLQAEPPKPRTTAKTVVEMPSQAKETKPSINIDDLTRGLGSVKEETGNEEKKSFLQKVLGKKKK